jgi:hypothetical protein
MTVIPEETRVAVYAQHGEKILNRIERGTGRQPSHI